MKTVTAALLPQSEKRLFVSIVFVASCVCLALCHFAFRKELVMWTIDFSLVSVFVSFLLPMFRRGVLFFAFSL